MSAKPRNNEFEELWFESPGGRLRYLHRPNPGKPALLGLHGFKDTAETFTFLEPLLAPNFELYFMDWAGHGESARVGEGYYSGARFMGDLVSFTGAVMPEQYFLMGHSMGAAVGTRFAGMFPESILGLVLFEGFSGLVSPETEWKRLRAWGEAFRRTSLRGEHKRLKNRLMAEQFLAKVHRRLSSEQIGVLTDSLTRPVGEAGELEWRHDPLLERRFVSIPFPPLVSRALWEKIECPMLILYGSETNLRPSEKSFKEAQAAGVVANAKDRLIKGADVELNDAMREIMSHFQDLEYHELEDAGHNLHHDQPAVVMDHMSRFFERIGLRLEEAVAP